MATFDDRERLVRWETAGGTWRVLDRRPDAAVVALCRCDGGEVVDRLVTAEPAALAYLRNRASSETTPAELAD